MRRNELFTGRLAKAFEGEGGSRHLSVLASGPELDRQGERLVKTALDQLGEQADAGTIFLTPSHDVPIPLGKSCGHSMDDAGHVTIDFLLKAENPLATQLFDEIQKNEWPDRQVSIWGDGVKKVVWDSALNKSVKEIHGLSINHVALTMPGQAAYQHAGITEAVAKAFKAKDTDALKASGLTEEEISKAYDAAGNWTPSTFAASWAVNKMADELPEMLDCLRWNINSIMYVDDPATKRTLLSKTFSEFTAVVLGEATEPAAKTEPGIDLVIKALGLTEGQTVAGLITEAISKAVLAPPVPAEDTSPAAPPDPPPPPPPSTEPITKAIPDTKPEDAPAVTAPVADAVHKAKEDREAVRKSIETETDPVKRGNLIQKFNALNAQE